MKVYGFDETDIVRGRPGASLVFFSPMDGYYGV